MHDLTKAKGICWGRSCNGSPKIQPFTAIISLLTKDFTCGQRPESTQAKRATSQGALRAPIGSVRVAFPMHYLATVKLYMASWCGILVPVLYEQL